MKLKIAIATLVAGFVCVAAPTPSHASEPWGACGWFDDSQKIVSTYNRGLLVPINDSGPIAGPGQTTLRCGTEGWGLRHIQARGHDDEFAYMADGTGMTWRQVAELGIAKALGDPARVTHNRDAETLCASAEIYLYNTSTGDYVGSRIVQVIIGDYNWNIVTAYPSWNHC